MARLPNLDEVEGYNSGYGEPTTRPVGSGLATVSAGIVFSKTGEEVVWRVW
jgi:hypothetical protein